jgi:predicted DNA-binding protein
MDMISLSGVTLVRLPLNVDGKTRNVILMEELNKRRKTMTERTGRTGATTMTEKTERTGTTGATTMTDSFLSTKMKQLKNIQATIESTTGETQEMWITKWYQLVRSIAKEIESSS